MQVSSVLQAPLDGWQPSLFGDVPVTDGTDHRVDGPAHPTPAHPTPAFVRHELAGGAWLDEAHGVVPQPDVLFEQLRAVAPWRRITRPMYERIVDEPRLTTGRWADPLPVLSSLALRLSEHYGLDLTSVSANLYRHGADSVAWHGDRTRRGTAHTVVAILSLGSPRRFLLRARPEVLARAADAPESRARRFVPVAGDLLVMGGTCQRTWEHAVPKCAHAGPRISVMFREPGAQDD